MKSKLHETSSKADAARKKWLESLEFVVEQVFKAQGSEQAPFFLDNLVDRLRAGMKLCFVGGGEWAVTDGDREIARYPWSALRFSISWKAYCFANEAEQRAWREHADDLLVAAVVDRLLADMRRRGALGEDERLTDHDLVERIIDTYIRFPPARP